MGKIGTLIEDGLNMLEPGRVLRDRAEERWKQADRLRSTNPQEAQRLEDQAGRLTEMGLRRSTRWSFTETQAARKDAKRQ